MGPICFTCYYHKHIFLYWKEFGRKPAVLGAEVLENQPPS
jgi:hypothetical protein